MAGGLERVQELFVVLPPMRVSTLLLKESTACPVRSLQKFRQEPEMVLPFFVPVKRLKASPLLVKHFICPSASLVCIA